MNYIDHPTDDFLDSICTQEFGFIGDIDKDCSLFVSVPENNMQQIQSEKKGKRKRNSKSEYTVEGDSIIMEKSEATWFSKKSGRRPEKKTPLTLAEKEARIQQKKEIDKQNRLRFRTKMLYLDNLLKFNYATFANRSHVKPSTYISILEESANYIKYLKLEKERLEKEKSMI